jgi:hypothetical protein
LWLVSDVRRGSRSAPGSGHDVTGPELDLNFPNTHFGCGTGLRMSNVAMDRRPTEEQAPAGELACFTALGTHEACQCPSGSGPALLRVWTGLNTGLTCHECHSGKQESADGPRHCISCHQLGTVQFARADPALYWYVHCTAQCRLGQARGCTKKKLNQL